ncbi:MAG: response regulator [Candidatus Paceibacterota bacterium]
MKNPPLILMVDDEPEIIKIYTTKLNSAGFKIISATNGVEGLEVAKKEIPDLILLDVKMPIMNGVDLFYELKKIPELKDSKIAFLTAFSDPNMPETDIKAAKDMGATDFIKKGSSLDEFVEKVKAYLQPQK